VSRENLQVIGPSGRHRIRAEKMEQLLWVIILTNYNKCVNIAAQAMYG
jgi:hypothetical protein